MAEGIQIEKQTAGESGRYLGRIDGVEGEAELDFAILVPKLIGADHTEAPASMRGTGAAMALAEHMIADARANGFKSFRSALMSAPNSENIPNGGR